MKASEKVFKLSPSDFAFLWEQCKRCFVLKVTRGIRQPSMPMAGIFKKLESLQMEFYEGRATASIAPDLPPGAIRCGEKWIESEVIRPEGRKSGAYVVGKLDSLIEFEDKSWGVLDFKTTAIREESLAKYGRQLNAYAFALEHPASPPRALREAPLALNPVSKIGLLCMEPTALAQPEPGRHVYEAAVKWVELPKDDAKFRAFVSEVLGVLEGPLPPPGEGCDWCQYVKTMGVQASMSAPAATKAAAPASPPPAAAGSPTGCPNCGGPMVQKSGRYGPFLSCTRYPDCRGTRNLGKERPSPRNS